MNMTNVIDTLEKIIKSDSFSSNFEESNDLQFAYLTMASIYKRSNNYEKMIEMYEIACKFNNTNAMNMLGNYYKHEMNDVDKAKQGQFTLPESTRKRNDECLITDEV